MATTDKAPTMAPRVVEKPILQVRRDIADWKWSRYNKVVFKDNKEWAKQNLQGEKVKPKEFKEEIHFSGRGINEYLNQPHDDFFVKNEMIRSMMSVLKEAEYLGYSEFEGRISYIFKIEIRKKANYIIVIKRNLNDKAYFYSISESEKVLKGLKK